MKKLLIVEMFLIFIASLNSLNVYAASKQKLDMAI